MAVLASKEVKNQEQELFEKLDKSIEDLEKGNLVSHEETMKRLKERLCFYDL